MRFFAEYNRIGDEMFGEAGRGGARKWRMSYISRRKAAASIGRVIADMKEMAKWRSCPSSSDRIGRADQILHRNLPGRRRCPCATWKMDYVYPSHVHRRCVAEVL